jgi:hypothetical protein
MPTNLRHDREYLLKIAEAMDTVQGTVDELQAKQENPPEPPAVIRAMMADMRDYFLYLTLDALDDRGLAEELIPILRELEGRSKTHRLYFSGLLQLLASGYRQRPTREEREEFGRRWKDTAKIIGVEG